MKVNIFDILGSYCGMHYYDMAFADVLRNRGHNVEIYSDFAELKGGKASFDSFFRCGKFIGFLRLLIVYIKFIKLLFLHRRERIIYLTYGELYEIPFLFLTFFSRNVFVDVHEIHALKYGDKSFVSLMFERMYGCIIHNAVCHSERTLEKLDRRVENVIYVPHFRYVFKKTYDLSRLGQDIKSTFKTNKTKFLFFGNLSIVKGIDIIIDVFSALNENENFELVIAGKNVDDVNLSDMKCGNISVFDRHITDDELVYLYSHTDFVLLPYRKSSQSGIFAMAAYFHKPMILSDIPYFRYMLDKYPSFGKMASLNGLMDLICDVISEKGNLLNYYTKTDCERFEMKEAIDTFVNKITQK